MAKPIIISFFTPDWKYPEYALNLRDQCEKHGLDYHIELKPSKGNYLKNTCLKPSFILECLKRFNRPVFWVDVDTEILSKPELNIKNCDVAAAVMGSNKNQYSHYVSCVYFNYTPAALEFVKTWIDNTGARSDHLGFDETIKQLKPNLLDLSNEYASFTNTGYFKIGVSEWAVKQQDMQISNHNLKIKACWFNGRPNFGDLLTPYIIEKLTGQEPEYAPIERANFLAVGSIAQRAREYQDVWGSGIIDSSNKPNNAFYHAVRGKLTREAIIKNGGDCPEIYGDPALLLPLFYQPKVEKKHKVGFIPHYVDQKHVKAGHVLDITRSDIEGFIDSINECERIVSSSLHGIIVAHAYGIPAAWVKWSGDLTGDDIKFYDYASSVGVELKPQNPKGKLNFVQAGQIDLMPLLKAFPYAFKHEWLARLRALQK